MIHIQMSCHGSRLLILFVVKACSNITKDGKCNLLQRSDAENLVETHVGGSRWLWSVVEHLEDYKMSVFQKFIEVRKGTLTHRIITTCLYVYMCIYIIMCI